MKNCLIISFILLFVISCKKEITYEGTTGEFKGTVIEYDENYNQISDCSGILVTAEGSDPLLQVTTNAAGEFSIKNLKTGIYDITFTKEGFATYKLVSFQFIGGPEPYICSKKILCKLPNVDITSLTIDTILYHNYYSYVQVKGTVSNDTTETRLRYFISDSPDVSYTNYQATDYESTYSSSGNFGSFSFNISSTILKMYGKKKQLYFIMYPYGSLSGGYTDITTGKTIYFVNPAKASVVVPFVVPSTTLYN